MCETALDDVLRGFLFAPQMPRSAPKDVEMKLP
jgi:hypothetical protein